MDTLKSMISFSKLARVGMLAGILTVLSVPTLAHDPGLSAAEVRILDDRIIAEVSFAARDLESVQRVDSQLLTIAGDERRLELRSVSRRLSDGNSVHFVLEFSSGDAAGLRISAPVLASLPRGHKQFCSVYDKDNKLLAERMFSAESADLTLDLRTTGSGNKSFLRFLLLGVEHILTGYDHLAFLLALLLAGGSLRDNAKIITSFTVAHSLTLAMATLGVINISAALVEPVIAASIVFVGLENLFRRRLAARWLVTFMFGLVHGLGFASALRELGIGAIEHGLKQAAIPLLSFNLGVEFAQIAIAALVLPFVWRLEQRPSFTLKHAPALSLLITFAGLYWLIARTVF
ncbi:MAG TPA: HupE/UreJ family protein [Pyrinomonadaceae bacterium]|nr:HupE/UreJ family protein [Pyrinomonadaceae bacterium]